MKSKAFTLAEVLITLGIIGIVAAMTMPTLINRQIEQQNVVKLKKAYSTFSNAMLRAVDDYSTLDNWGFASKNATQASIESFEKVKPYLKLMKYCSNQQGCLKDVHYKNLNGTNATNFNQSTNLVKGQFTDGTVFLWDVISPTCEENNGDSPKYKNSCGRLTIDVNGYKEPNQYGKDFFVFAVTKNSILPWGMDGMGGMSGNYNNFKSCNLNGTGTGCAAWVIYNENMDYLHCDDLSWEGKKKCK